MSEFITCLKKLSGFTNHQGILSKKRSSRGATQVAIRHLQILVQTAKPNELVFHWVSKILQLLTLMHDKVQL